MLQNRTILTGCILSLVIVCLGIWWLNRGYGEVSQEGYQYALALVSICNREDEARLQTIELQIDESEKKGILPGEDVRVLRAIIGQAQAGKWDRADSAIRRLLEDQVRKVDF